MDDAVIGEGDFVVLRADGCFAYQLAVVVDDAAQGVTDVVRGADLLDSTPRQIWLQRLLGFPQPRYLHVPVVVEAEGEKLSKQTLAPPLDPDRDEEHLRAALRFLGQSKPPPGVEILPWAIAQWDATGVTKSTGD
jgi:glutamyl-Q tRNA(Asp) synthetase